MALRATLRNLHLYTAAFLVPFIFLMALSGGLEILGVKGTISRQLIHKINTDKLNFNSPTITQDVIDLFKELAIDARITRLRRRNRSLYTRPSYAGYYGLKIRDGYIKIYQYTPDIVRRLMTLHKGGGPAIYQFYQKLMVFGLLLILSIGLWLGLTSVKTRKNSAIIFIVGMASYLAIII